MILPERFYRVAGVPWGLGAIMTNKPEPGWQCPHHEGKPAKGDSVHHYADGDTACTTCARAWLVSIGEAVPVLDAKVAPALAIEAPPHAELAPTAEDDVLRLFDLAAAS